MWPSTARICFLYALLPLMAVVAVGRRAGLLAEGGLIMWSVGNSYYLLPIISQ